MTFFAGLLSIVLIVMVVGLVVALCVLRVAMTEDTAHSGSVHTNKPERS